ncbi:MAG: UDP-N-acetylglucosamine--LPS N-acetylglucosamine transferase [Candidatus Diapherotrites archaeon]|uniref:UDP-N-acetylglucosamine--LPS N-acetylglucosamine transferase n=1 Tax=Candidatus Iainarchaeum sp. TaxID=3101447 RepID=A0A7J4IUX5_9ARCH|nr:MAG: polysaccharide biosynthesis protein CpsF [archaeon GW2011_AR10]MBS3058964.1 UDP-N-acetylglucosamine--LPS N-acetylglucosamine transferase [Candidatus Diapherotrites archaeon]HIH08594.1 UDP-N-acetylglucosamine--LPS N-acetylglucosamine transferase [Candidatus Diapherotrites archaeon]
MAKEVALKLCLACSGGGHLSELMQLEEFYMEQERFFVTFKRPNSEELAKKERVYFVTDPGRNPVALAKNFFESMKVFRKEKPDAVVTTGAGVAFPISLIAKLAGKKVVYIESFCRISSPSLSARLFYPIADKFFVQWPQMKKFFPKAVFAGGVF